jgi:hypothetical protein
MSSSAVTPSLLFPAEQAVDVRSLKLHSLVGCVK